MNVTIQKLHKAFPDMSVEDILVILDCYTEDPKTNFKNEYRQLIKPDYRRN